MATVTLLENAAELKLPIGNYATVDFDLVAEVTRGNLGSQIGASTTTYSGTIFNQGVQPAFFVISNPVVNDNIVNPGTRTFDVLMSGTVNGKQFSDTITVSVQDDEAGKSILLGTEGRDVDLGTTAPETIQALGGNDRILASPSDGIDGGAGLDTVVVSGTNWLNPIKTAAGWTINNLTGSPISMTNVERVQISSSTIVALDVDGTAGMAYRIYQAAFARTPDKGGISFWINQMDKGMALRDVAAGFVSSQEFRTAYGTSPSNTQLVDKLYQNVLGRTAEKAGVDYWVGVLEGGTSVSDVLANISESAENQANVANVIGRIGIQLDASFFIL